MLRTISRPLMGIVVASLAAAAMGRVAEFGPPMPRGACPAERVPEGLSASEWSGIRAAYEANRHAAFAVDGGWQARNPGQQWTTHFDGCGFLTVPDAATWTWGLQLSSYGFAGCERTISAPATISANGQRIEHGWDEALTEWYSNDQRGLEHGYTLHQRPISPSGSAGPLQLTLAVRGTLVPRINANKRGVAFVNDSGAAVVNYNHLTVFDADGASLPAWFAEAGDGLMLSVDDRGARYPMTIDPIAQQAYLKASNTWADDFFGSSVAVSGDTVVVGAPYEDSSATGVNGNQADNNATDSGAAYVFVRNESTWSQQAYLKASNTGESDNFGMSVAVSGDTVVVGAHDEDSNATGVNGNQADNSAFAAGAAYVFVRDAGVWSQQAYLKASNTAVDDYFGGSVAVNGDTVVVAAPFEGSSATGVNGNQADNSAVQSGAAYVFVRPPGGTTWSQQAYLKASNTGESDNFGSSMAASGDTIVVGAGLEDSGATGVNGNGADNSASNAGAAYVFVRNESTWSQQAYLKASNTGLSDLFGFSVAVSGDTAVVGAYLEDSNATGVNGNGADNSASGSGAAYVFVRPPGGTAWSQQDYLKASNTGLIDLFGWSVAVSGDTVVVGARGEDSNATGVNGNQADNSAHASGAAYVFVRAPGGTTWSQQAYLKASNTGTSDEFGYSVAVSGDTVVVGAHQEDSSATGVDGNQADNSALYSGAAYVFSVPTLPSDIDGNGEVDGADLGSLLLDWGKCPRGASCPADLTGDGIIDGADLGVLLLNWTS